MKNFSSPGNFRIMRASLNTQAAATKAKSEKRESVNKVMFSAFRFPLFALLLRSRFLAFPLLLLVCGCVTHKQTLFTATGPDWHVQQGQALWRPQKGMPEFGGDLVLARDNAGRCLIQFDKTPMAILSAQVTSNEWLIKFPQRQMSFSGYGTGWTRFAWLYLPRALDGKPLPKQFHFESKPDGGWSLENRSTGEKLEGFLAP